MGYKLLIFCVKHVMHIPMLAILIIIFAGFNIIFINGGNIPKEIFESVKVVKGKVLGISEEMSVLPVAQTVERNKITVPKKIQGASELDMLAGSGAVIDCASDTVLFNKQADQLWPIASITKLMTALVFLDYNPGWETVYQIALQDRKNGGKIYLYVGEKVKVKDLFYLSLVGSANTATMALVNSTGLSEAEFVEKMNQKAAELNLNNTRFNDPTGLNNANVSTAEEAAIMAKIALDNEYISQAGLTKKYEFSTIDGRGKTVYNTDSLLDIFPQNGIKILGGKTGYLEAAGYCFIAKFTNQDGNEIITVVLGADSDNDRFSQTKELAEWVYESYKW